MGKWEIRPLATPKNLNRSSPNTAHVITSWISTHNQNLVTMPQGVSFPVCVKLRIKNVYLASFCGFFQRPTAQDPGPIFTQNTSSDVVPRTDVPVLRYKKKHLIPLFPKNRHLGPIFDGT